MGDRGRDDGGIDMLTSSFSSEDLDDLLEDFLDEDGDVLDGASASAFASAAACFAWTAACFALTDAGSSWYRKILRQRQKEEEEPRVAAALAAVGTASMRNLHATADPHQDAHRSM